MMWILRKHGDGRSFGPLADGSLRRWAWEGLIEPDDEVSNDSGSTWTRAGDTAIVTPFMATQTHQPVLAHAEVMPARLRRHRGKGSLLDLTPFVDCVFLLLIFFFVATSFDARSSLEAATSKHGLEEVRLDVSVPKVDDRPNGQREVRRQVRVVVRDDGEVTVDGRRVSLSSLASELRSLQTRDRGLVAIILADPEVRYGLIARVVAAIETSGIEQVLIEVSGPNK